VVYPIENSRYNIKAGYSICGEGWQIDPVYVYYLLRLSNRTCIEIVKEKDNFRLATILHNGFPIGTCASKEQIKVLGLEHDLAWDLSHHGKPFGIRRRRAIVKRDSLCISRPNSEDLPLILEEEFKFKDIFKAVWSILTLSFLYRPAPVSNDFIIPTGSGIDLSEEETLFYFAVSLYFRFLLFGSHEIT